ncbi:hypothetical protein HYDPIDRAFT_165022 [Hydnomerulius pinastri MD-312]|nr:hypothetical protein HYDPIDRAFT_165022 [Hydnomerulius pinastri MD-312]
MHRALRVTDLLLNIFSQLDDPGPDSEEVNRRRTKQFLRSLARLARTCRPFCDPALDLLYKEIDLESLLLCLGNKFFASCASREPADAILYPKDWDVLFKYARRVRRIEHERFSESIIQHAFRTLSCPPSGAPLFPNLLSLLWSDGSPERLHYAHNLVGPNLKSLTLDLMMILPGPAECSIIISLATLCPSLEIFCLRTRKIWLSKLTPLAIATCVQSWSRLRSISCERIDHHVLFQLACLPALRHISVSFAPSMDFEALKSDLCPSPFPSLREVELNLSSLPLTSDFLDLTCAGLSKFQVSLPSDVCTATEYRRLFDVLYAPGTPKVVESIHIHQATLDSQQSPKIPSGRILTLDTLRSLLAFSSLSSLTIDSSASFDLTDDDLGEVAATWPNLEVLALNETWGWRKASKITFSGLITLLARCPKLVHLALTIDTAKSHTRSTKRPGGGVCNQRITTLFLGDSTVEDVTSVAIVLSDILPELCEINAWQSSQMESSHSPARRKKYLTLWLQVWNLYHTLRVVRRQERLWRDGGDPSE